MNKITNNDENDAFLVPMKKRLKMAFENAQFELHPMEATSDLEKLRACEGQYHHEKIAEQQQQQQQQPKPKRGEKEALKIAKKSKLEDDITWSRAIRR